MDSSPFPLNPSTAIPTSTISWLRDHGLSLSNVRCPCPRWLLTSRCDSTPDSQRVREHDLFTSTPSHTRWFNFATAWKTPILAGRPAPTLLLLQVPSPPSDLTELTTRLTTFLTTFKTSIHFLGFAIRPTPVPELSWNSPDFTTIELWNTKHIPAGLSQEVWGTGTILTKPLF